MSEPDVVEGSLGLREIFPVLYRDAVVFTLPVEVAGDGQEDDDQGLTTAVVEARLVGDLRAILERMALPFPMIATEVGYAREGVMVEQISVFEIVDGTLMIQAQSTIGDHKHLQRSFGDYDLRDGHLLRVRPNRSLAERDVQMIDVVGFTAARHLIALMGCLTSTGRGHRFSRRVCLSL